jgi:hypothetical protein
MTIDGERFFIVIVTAVAVIVCNINCFVSHCGRLWAGHSYTTELFLHQSSYTTPRPFIDTAAAAVTDL